MFSIWYASYTINQKTAICYKPFSLTQISWILEIHKGRKENSEETAENQEIHKVDSVALMNAKPWEKRNLDWSL